MNVPATEQGLALATSAADIAAVTAAIAAAMLVSVSTCMTSLLLPVLRTISM
jgi:uncharacterized protein involved in propanediol utilization